jgi:hypothetical protein
MHHIGRTIVLVTAIGFLGAGPSHVSAQATPTPEQRARIAATQRAFCAGIKKLASLAATNFQAVDTGSRSDGKHNSSLKLPTASECYIDFDKGATHWCIFEGRADKLFAETTGLMRNVSRCVGEEMPVVLDGETFTATELTSSGVRYSVVGSTIAQDGTASMGLTVQPAE